MKNFWPIVWIAFGVFVMLTATTIVTNKLTTSAAVFHGEDYEREGYHDAWADVPIELCPYVRTAEREWWLRGYKKGWKERNGKK